MKKRLCVFAHFDAQGEIKPFTLFYLRKLREECDEIVFVTVSNPGPEELRKLEGIVSQVILRPNVGYDFAMWQQALAECDLTQYEELLLTNSSVFGPIWPLNRVFAKMANVACDVWGMTENTEIDWHLQSYFLVFRHTAIESEAFRQFWAAVLPFRNKTQVIRSYEVGLSVFLKESGLALRAMVELPRDPRPRLVRMVRRPPRQLNPTCSRPIELIAAGMPLVKLELFRDNPIDVDLRAVRREIERAGYDMSLVVYDRPRSEQALRSDVP